MTSMTINGAVIGDISAQTIKDWQDGFDESYIECLKNVIDKILDGDVYDNNDETVFAVRKIRQIVKDIRAISNTEGGVE